MGKKEKPVVILAFNLKERDDMEDLGTELSVLLQLIFKKCRIGA